MPRAQSADGVMHDFPEGTEPAVIDKAMKDYATKAAGPSFGEGFGAGLLDKAYGAAQLGAHTAAVPEQALAGDFGMVPEEARKSVDETAAKRERTLESEGYNKGWGRTVGNLAGDVAVAAPLTALPGAPAVGWLRRALQGARLGAEGGAVSGATQPVGGSDYEAEKTKQIGIGGGVGAVVGGGAGALAKAISRNSPEETELFIRNSYNRAIKPTVAGKETASDLAKSNEQMRGAVSTIIGNKANLSFVDSDGRTVTGELPKTIEQFADAIEQTKQKVFEQYDAMAQRASAARGTRPVHPRFSEQFEASAKREAQARQDVSRAQQAVTTAAAKQSRAGDNVYMSNAANEDRRAADTILQRAQAELDRAQRAKESAQQKLYSIGVDLRPAVKELEKLARDPIVKDLHPELAGHLETRMATLTERGAYTVTDAQRAVQNLNASLKAFYRNPSYETAGRASIDAMVANNLRKGLDDAIKNATGPGYQELKNLYGALTSIEKDVVHRAIVEGRKNAGGGLLGNIGDVVSADEVLRGLATFNPQAVATGALLKGFTSTMKYLRDPNRAVRRLFEAAERPPAGVSAAQPGAPSVVHPDDPVARALRPY